MTKRSFPPLAGERVTVLVLGSLPGERSLAVNEYYGHPRNRFWQVIARVTGQSLPTSYHEKTSLLSRAGIALWDVVREADREGSLDSDIRHEVPNDIPRFVAEHAGTRLVVFNGQTPAALFKKHFSLFPDIPLVTLPSTSPANAAWHIDRLCQAWHDTLLQYL
ncbi:MAG: DNA-deoxyinosine glycosylase [Odoribacteraceae bacterium]|jgi:hypoxanthine-DNA glycosylase|nr:DNA-deoxyinosine glycosylase [Odoribacteraceae bacterium]